MLRPVNDDDERFELDAFTWRHLREWQNNWANEPWPNKRRERFAEWLIDNHRRFLHDVSWPEITRVFKHETETGE